MALLNNLPGGTSSSLTLNGNAVRAVTASDPVIDAGNGNLLRSIVLHRHARVELF